MRNLIKYKYRNECTIITHCSPKNVFWFIVAQTGKTFHVLQPKKMYRSICNLKFMEFRWNLRESCWKFSELALKWECTEKMTTRFFEKSKKSSQFFSFSSQKINNPYACRYLKFCLLLRLFPFILAVMWTASYTKASIKV